MIKPILGGEQEENTHLIGENESQLLEETVYINHYYYNQLDNPGKIIYKALEDNIENMKSGNYQIEFGKQFNDLLNSKNGEQKLNTSFQSAWNAFSYDYAHIFYIDVTKLVLTTQTTTIGGFSTHKVSLSSGNNENYFSEEITSKEEAIKKTEYISNIRKQFISQLQNYSEYEQIKLVHNWLVDNLEYDTSFKEKNIHNVYGAFYNKKVVCEAYARTFKYILDGIGIENVLVSGEATNSNNEREAHAWNYVKIDGKWYAVDVTWDDPIITGGGKLTNKSRYKYFVKGSNTMNENHQPSGRFTPDGQLFTYPELSIEDYE